ncbi:MULTISPECIES: sensor histidine kinase [Bacillus]|uniref:histidine kinase n=1 Tax=Bacillus glycinifermentans TaxID=1664069 RepID=A0AAJ4D2Z0_9BACI|nr:MULTISPECIES: HAMP domain-containing sensor histidine kinase [Bacillus]KKB72164.1 ATPase [Bacillus sp. TH008]MBU8788457.1 HAMP domain-containing histidine kinase [Bacillus glycinifermentans]MDU0073438.1 HAMP domain-containing sensor histidine kinase [Bacillus sp. IG6]MED8021300.1 HAMP domain-containing sensor histidine kinase [Bacillus glycinifermentans]NUJ18564.1 HAMP domain-containing histidine kinase [Bacillus glycinifermentans]
MLNDHKLPLFILQFAAIAGLLFINMNTGSLGVFSIMLYVLLLGTTAVLFLSRLRFNKHLELMDTELKRVAGGNLRRRLLANDDPLFNEIIFSINELIEQLEKVQIDAAQSEMARKRLLSNISHDIRTPLTSIIGYIDALKDGVASSEKEKQEYLNILSKKSSSLKQLIDEIFNMAKLDANEIPLNIESFDLAELVRETLINFLPELKKHDIELNVHIPEKKCFIMADRLSLIRVIENLVKNGVHYGKAGKILGIELRETDREYQLLVWDKGPGIPEHDIENVFERMYRRDRSRKLGEGSGLGLAIAKSLVEKNRGTIWAESTPWEKTTFGFSLPKQNHLHLFKK